MTKDPTEGGYLRYIDGMVDSDELHCLSKYSELVPENGAILDIGTSDGRSALSLGLHSKDSVHVYTVDIEVEEKFYKHVDYLELNHKVFFTRCTSKRLSELWKTPLDMVFVDGSHNYDDVVLDIQNWIPHIKKDGIIAFHDYGNQSFGVTQAIDEFEGKLFEKIDNYKLVYVARKL